MKGDNLALGYATRQRDQPVLVKLIGRIGPRRLAHNGDFPLTATQLPLVKRLHSVRPGYKALGHICDHAIDINGRTLTEPLSSFRRQFFNRWEVQRVHPGNEKTLMQTVENGVSILLMNPVFPLEDPVVLDDPFPFFQKCRAESPVLFHEPWQSWFLFRYDDLAAISRSANLSNQRIDLFIDAAPVHLRDELAFLENDLADMVVMLDGPEHQTVRQIVQQGFSPRVIDHIRKRIEYHVDTLIGETQAGRAFDAAPVICRQLPILVLADMLDIPRADFPRLLQWANAFVDYFNRVPVPEEQARALIHHGKDMIAYVQQLIEERRKHPGADFISTLICGELDGHRLTDRQVLANAVMLLIAGNDTVGSALGNALDLLLNHPDAVAQIRAGAASWETAFDEVMRCEPANPVILRKVATSFDFQGRRLDSTHKVFLVLASASRDEKHFPESERFDVTRTGNRHMGFGVGSHHCLGSLLARAQAGVLLPQLFDRMKGLRRVADQPSLARRTLGVRGFLSLPLIYDELFGVPSQ